jgi:hypothetical protein
MKNLCFICIGILMSYTVVAQTTSIFDSTSRWVLRTDSYSPSTLSSVLTYGEFIDGDTLINSQSYKKVKRYDAWRSGQSPNMGGGWSPYYISYLGQQARTIGGIREDSLKRVYYYNLNYSQHLPSLQEFLLYDFGMTVGDSIMRYQSDQDSFYMHLTKIDSVQLLDSVYRRRFHLSGRTYQAITASDSIYYYWIEGVGTARHPNLLAAPPIPQGDWYPTKTGLLGGWHFDLYGSLAGAGASTDITCFFVNDKELLFNQTNCDTLSPHLLAISQLTQTNNTQIKLYPNPFQQQATLQIEGLDYDKLQLQIFDVTGRIVQEKNTADKEIIIHKNKLPAGLYFYKLWADERAAGTGKFTIIP